MNDELPAESCYSINTLLERELLYSFIKSLPDNSIIVEVGSAIGGSSCVMASANPTNTINCVDSFEGDVGYIYHWKNIKYNFSDVELNNILDNCFSIDPSGKLAFETLTKKYTNIKLHNGKSPKEFLNWNQPIDLYFEDATHQNPGLSSNIDFWTTHIKPGGFIIGHDYSSEHPDVKLEFNKLLMTGWSLISKIDSLIILQKPLA
jgi:hypothetical protein